MENRIGPFEFIDLAGNPDTVMPQIGLFVRSGVSGLTLVNDGVRGEPFVLRSKVDVETLAAARATYTFYTGLIGAEPQEIIWQDIDLSAEGTRFSVLKVKQVSCIPIDSATGGLFPPSLAWLECDWTLVAIDVTSP